MTPVNQETLKSLIQEFGPCYSVHDARRDSNQNLAARAALKIMKGYPHIEIEPLLEEPVNTCRKHDKNGKRFYNGRMVDCLCRWLNREPLEEEFQAEYKQQSL